MVSDVVLAIAGWRVNDDAVLLGLAGFTMASCAPWSADRSPALSRPRRGIRRGRAHRWSPDA